MRRKGSPQSDYPSRSYVIRKEIDNERLALLGAISLAWNHLEASVDVALGACLEVPEPMWVEITSRINGLDAKVGIVKAALSEIIRAPDIHKRAIQETLGQVEHHKKYRDGLAHALILDPTQPVAPTIQRKGKTDEVIVSKDALEILYERLIHFNAEMDTVGWIFCDLSLIRDRPFKTSASVKQKCKGRFQSSVARLHHLQKMRKSLRPLPEFPDLPPTRGASEGSQEPQG